MPSIDDLLAGITAIPLHRFLGLHGLQAADGQASLKITVNENTANPAGVLHGGVAYALCDVVAYAALLTCIEAGAGAVTHDIHVSVIRAAPLGAEVEFRGQVVRKGGRIAFLDAQALSAGEIIASARVTKSLLPSAEK